MWEEGDRMTYTDDEKETIRFLRKMYATNPSALDAEMETLVTETEANNKVMLKGFAVKVISGLERDKAGLQKSFDYITDSLAVLKRVRDG